MLLMEMSLKYPDPYDSKIFQILKVMLHKQYFKLNKHSEVLVFQMQMLKSHFFLLFSVFFPVFF